MSVNTLSKALTDPEQTTYTNSWLYCGFFICCSQCYAYQTKQKHVAMLLIEFGDKHDTHAINTTQCHVLVANYPLASKAAILCSRYTPAMPEWNFVPSAIHSNPFAPFAMREQQH